MYAKQLKQLLFMEKFIYIRKCSTFIETIIK